MEQRANTNIDVRTVTAHRLHLIIATVVLFTVLTFWMYWLLSDSQSDNMALFLVGNMVLGFVSIWTLIAGILLQVAMGVKTSSIVLMSVLALFLPWLVAIFLIVRASIKLIHARRDLLGTESASV